MRSPRKMSRRGAIRIVFRLVAAAGLRLMRPLLTVSGLAATGRAAGQDDDPEILVRVITPDVIALKSFIASNRVEVIRVMLPALGERDAVATLLMRKSVAAKARLINAFKVQILDEPRRAGVGVPPVNRSNRFADTRVLPDGPGKLVKRPS